MERLNQFKIINILQKTFYSKLNTEDPKNETVVSKYTRENLDETWNSINTNTFIEKKKINIILASKKMFGY